MNQKRSKNIDTGRLNCIIVHRILARLLRANGFYIRLNVMDKAVYIIYVHKSVVFSLHCTILDCDLTLNFNIVFNICEM